jgi:hypothetical protein
MHTRIGAIVTVGTRTPAICAGSSRQEPRSVAGFGHRHASRVRAKEAVAGQGGNVGTPIQWTTGKSDKR